MGFLTTREDMQLVVILSWKHLAMLISSNADPAFMKNGFQKQESSDSHMEAMILVICYLNDVINNPQNMYEVW